MSTAIHIKREKIVNQDVPTFELNRLLEKSLRDRGVKYQGIFNNGSFVYQDNPEKRNYLFTVDLGNKNRLICWNIDEGWKMDTHAHPFIDRRSVTKRELESLLGRAFKFI